ncbi:MAG: hypothetical protein J6X18_01225 [Bacteroidales bacterium]|nr:hypothetical protein [Bacteroidales bacterium]
MIKEVFEKTLMSEIESVMPSDSPACVLQFKQEEHNEEGEKNIYESIKKFLDDRKKVRDATEEEKTAAMKIMKMSPERFSLMDVYLTAGGKIAVRTPESTWLRLCGREWHVDMEKGTYECVALS